MKIFTERHISHVVDLVFDQPFRSCPFLQVSNTAPSSRRSMVREDSVLVGGCGPPVFGWIVMGFVVVDSE
ncbi:hypothetical protein, partial [Micromonospora sp. ALFpr18c]|uniref:hypothetical protein n=1 Tax=Micromonospora sp. ALFpr18c TaxID=1458665 RepID=UPI001CECDDA6